MVLNMNSKKIFSLALIFLLFAGLNLFLQQMQIIATMESLLINQ